MSKTQTHDLADLFDVASLASMKQGKQFSYSARKGNFEASDLGQAVLIENKKASGVTFPVIVLALAIARDTGEDTLTGEQFSAGEAIAEVLDAEGTLSTLLTSRYSVYPQVADAEQHAAMRAEHHARAELRRRYVQVKGQDITEYKTSWEAYLSALTEEVAKHDLDKLTAYRNVNAALADYVDAELRKRPAPERAQGKGKQSTKVTATSLSAMREAMRKAQNMTPAQEKQVSPDDLANALDVVETLK